MSDRMPPSVLVGLYGESGTGKTLLAGGWCQALKERFQRPVLYADWENSTVSLPAEVFEDIELWEPSEFGGPGSGSEGALSDAMRLLAEARSKLTERRISGMVIDTVSSMGVGIVADAASQKLSEKGVQRVTMRAGSVTVNVPSLLDYRSAANFFTAWVRGLVSLAKSGLPILVLSHENAVSLETSGGIVENAVVGPLFVGNKLTRQLPGVFSSFYRVGMRSTSPTSPPRLFFETARRGLYYANDRIGALPPGGLDIQITDASSGIELRRKAVAKGKEIWAAVLAAHYDKFRAQENKED